MGWNSLTYTTMNGCSISASQCLHTEIKRHAEPDDNELHSMPIYLFSFCVSIFYPFYRDTLIFIIHRCHHCLMYTTWKGSKRMHESPREMLKKINYMQEWEDHGGVSSAFCPGSLGQVKKIQLSSTEDE